MLRLQARKKELQKKNKEGRSGLKRWVPFHSTHPAYPASYMVRWGATPQFEVFSFVIKEAGNEEQVV